MLVGLDIRVGALGGWRALECLKVASFCFLEVYSDR